MNLPDCSAISGRIVAATTERIARTQWAPKITYEYVVNGTPFTGSRLAFDHDKAYAASEANKIAESFPVGKRVEVFHDPDRPSESTLRESDQDASRDLIFLCVVLLAPTVFCASVGVIGFVQSWGR